MDSEDRHEYAIFVILAEDPKKQPMHVTSVRYELLGEAIKRMFAWPWNEAIAEVRITPVEAE